MQHLNDEQLIHQFESLVAKERKITAEVVAHLFEVKKRKLYLNQGCTSLFDYLTKKLAYAPASAQRRIEAVRLLEVSPELKDNLASGEINLAQVSVLAHAFRQKDCTDKEKKEILEKVKGEGVASTQTIVEEELEIPPQVHEKEKHQRDESVRMEITFTKEQMAKFQRLRELVSHQHPNPTWAELFELSAVDSLEKRDPVTHHNFRRERGGELSKAEIRRRVFRRDECCQWIDPVSGLKCDSKFQLEVDHIQPKWAGGPYTLENLQLLCGVHNRLKYERCG